MSSRYIVLLLIAGLMVSGICFAAYTTITGNVVYSTNQSVLPGANVSFYNMTLGVNGPPTYTLINSTLTNATGGFTLGYDNNTGNSQTMFKMTIKKYNATSAPQTLQFTTPPTLPDLPIFALRNAFTTLTNMNMSVGLVPAATLLLNATNSSGDQSNFGYFIKRKGHMEDLGWTNNATNGSIEMDSTQEYIITVFRTPNLSGGVESGVFPRSYTLTKANFTNDAVNNTIRMTVNLTPAISFVSGNLNVTGNSTRVNFSDIVFYSMVDSEVFYGSQSRPLNPGSSQMGGSTPSSTAVGMNLTAASGAYNVSLPAASTGITYLMMAFANESSTNASYAATLNVTLNSSANLTYNLTLRPMNGNYTLTGYTDDPNVSKVAVYLNDSSSGSLISSNAGMLDINVTDYNTYGVFTYKMMVEANSTGTFLIPSINGSNTTYEVFTMGKSPRKGSLNTTISPAYIQMKGMQFEDPDHPGDSAIFKSISVNFYYSNVTCDVQQPPANCLLTTFSVGDDHADSSFDPLAFSMAGINISLMITESNTGIRLFLANVDLIASGPPNAEFDSEATTTTGSASSLERAWRIGSFAPKVFNNAFIGLSYSDGELNDAQPVRMLLSTLYDDSWNDIWNTTGHPNADNVPAYYADYDTTLLNASTNGALCDTSNTSAPCFINTSTNIIWISIPHFSGSLPTVLGTLVSSTSSTTRSDSSRRMDVTVESADCPEEQLTVTVTAGGEPLEEAEVRLAYPITDFEIITTNADGVAVFDISEVRPISGEYRAIVTKSGYTKADTRFDYSQCPVQETVEEEVVEEVTEPEEEVAEEPVEEQPEETPEGEPPAEEPAEEQEVASEPEEETPEVPEEEEEEPEAPPAEEYSGEAGTGAQAGEGESGDSDQGSSGLLPAIFGGGALLIIVLLIVIGAVAYYLMGKKK